MSVKHHFFSEILKIQPGWIRTEVLIHLMLGWKNIA